MKKGKIVVVDDSIVNLKLVYDILSSEGYAVIMVKEGVQAQHTCIIEQPDLILLDIIMPDANGIEICKALKLDAKTATIPVLFLTAKTESESLIDGFTAGGVDYITKPFNFKELVVRVHTHIELKKSVQTIQSQADELKSLAKAKNSVYDFASFATLNVYEHFKQIETILTNKIDLPEFEFNQLTYYKNTLSLQLKNLQFWLDFKSGKLIVNKTEFNLNEHLQRYKEVFDFKLQQNNVTPIVDFLYSNILINADSNFIKLALLNAFNFFVIKLKNNTLKITSGIVNERCFIEFETNAQVLTEEELTLLKSEYNMLSENFEHKEVFLGLRIIQTISQLHYGGFNSVIQQNLTKFRIELAK